MINLLAEPSPIQQEELKEEIEMTLNETMFGLERLRTDFIVATTGVDEQEVEHSKAQVLSLNKMLLALITEINGSELNLIKEIVVTTKAGIYKKLIQQIAWLKEQNSSE